MTFAKPIIIQGCLTLPDRILPDGELEIEGDRIVAVRERPRYDNPAFRWERGWIFPGLVDVHVHGAGGFDFMDGKPESLAQLDCVLGRAGCTRYLATTMSGSRERLESVLDTLATFRKVASGLGLCGVHLEGPFIHPQYCGAQGLEAIRNPSVDEVEGYLSRFPHLIRRITVAPELPGADSFLEFCRSADIAISAGHSQACFDEAMSAFSAGVQQVTHLFNAMPPLHHRDPGLAGAALTHPDVTVEVIADGVHLHPATIQLVARLKGPDHVALVTDAMRAALLDDGMYDLGGQTVTVRNGVARIANGNLAGSTLTLLRAIFQYRQFAGVDLPEAVGAASLVPARMAGLTDCGALQPGFAADLLFVDADGSNCMTWRNGQVLYDGR